MPTVQCNKHVCAQSSLDSLLQIRRYVTTVLRHCWLFGRALVAAAFWTLRLITYSTLFRHSVTAEKATNKQTQEAETWYKCSQIKSFSSRLTKPQTAPQIELRLSMNFVKNFCLRHTVKLDTDLILNMTEHSCTISTYPVLNNFISSRACTKSSDRLSTTLTGQFKRPIHTTISA